LLHTHAQIVTNILVSGEIIQHEYQLETAQYLTTSNHHLDSYQQTLSVFFFFNKKYWSKYPYITIHALDKYSELFCHLN